MQKEDIISINQWRATYIVGFNLAKGVSFLFSTVWHIGKDAGSYILYYRSASQKGVQTSLHPCTFLEIANPT